MKMILIISTTLSFMFMQSSHPAMLMILILCQTLMICVLIWMKINTSWFSYIMFLIFVGGLMVLFVYIVSLAANEMFSLNVKATKIYLTSTAMFFMLLTSMNSQLMENPLFKSFNSVYMIYSESMTLITSSTMTYLLLTLVVVVKMTSKYEGPLRNTIFYN